MKRLAILIERLDNSPSEKIRQQALLDYVGQAPEDDLNWAMVFLLDGLATPRLLRQQTLLAAATHAAGLRDWLAEVCREEIRDIPELAALLAPRATNPRTPSLAALVMDYCLPLQGKDEPAQKLFLCAAWQEFDLPTRRIWHRILLGGLRPKPSRLQLAAALSHRYGIRIPLLLQRFEKPPRSVSTAEWLQHWIRPAGTEETLGWPAPWRRPVEDQAPDRSSTLAGEWRCEWIPHGRRVQLVRRTGRTFAWSADGDLLNRTLNHLIQAAGSLEEGVVLEGIWVDHPPESLASPMRAKPSVGHFWVEDILEYRGEDQRQKPWSQRSECLDRILSEGRSRASQPKRAPADARLAVSTGQAELFKPPTDSPPEAQDWPFYRIPTVPCDRPDQLRTIRLQAQAKGYAGIRLWNRQPAVHDSDCWQLRESVWLPNERRRCVAVLLSLQNPDAESEFCLGIPHNGRWLTIARVRGEIPESERTQVTTFVHENTTQRFGATRCLNPLLRVALSYDYPMPSNRHRAGLKLVNARWESLIPPSDSSRCSHLEEL